MLWLVLTLFLQGLVATHHATAMAAGIEVCSAGGGVHRVDADGQPLSAASVHDCCCAGLDAAPLPSPAACPSVADEAPRSASPIGAAPSAEWRAPLSRGPPAPASPN